MHNSSSVVTVTAGAAAATGYTPLQATLIGASAGALSLVTIAGNLMVRAVDVGSCAVWLSHSHTCNRF